MNTVLGRERARRVAEDGRLVKQRGGPADRETRGEGE